MKKVLRYALSGSALSAGLLISAAPAQAACVVTPAGSPVTGTVVCGNTTTADTTYPTNFILQNDRNYLVDTSAGAVTGTVTAGTTVNGFGLAFTNTVGGANALNVVNGGVVQVNLGNTATAGGGAALNVTAIGATPVNYSGAGDVLNLGSGNGLEFTMLGTGALVANVGGSVLSTNGNAIYLNKNAATAGNATITTTAGETITAGSGGYGILVDAGGAINTATGTLTVNNNAAIGTVAGALTPMTAGISVDNSGTGNIVITNGAGAIGSTTDRATFWGIVSNSYTSGNISITTGTGSIFSSNGGVGATNSGTGNLTISTGTGTINSTGLYGIYGAVSTGNLSITAGGPVTAATTAITALNSGAGTQTVNVNGAVTATAGTGLLSISPAARTITIGSAGSLTGTTQAIQLSGAGAATIQNNGTVGSASTGLALLTSGTGAVTLTNGTATVHTPVINGRLTFNAGADTFTNNAVWNTQGTTDFGAGADTLNNAVGSTVNIQGNTILANLETLTLNGLINMAAGTSLTGTGPFTIGTTGELDTAGNATLIGFTSVNNNGLMDLAAGTLTVPAVVFTNSASGRIEVDEGLSTITGQTSFVNDGAIDMIDGDVADQLTINSNYTGVGRLQVDVSGTSADRLVINGTAGGQTAIDVNTVGLGVFDPDGILVVDVSGASTGAFVMGEEVANPLINFDVAQIGNDYFLITLLDPETAFIPVAATGMLREMWYQSADEVFAQTLAPTAVEGLSIWADIYGSQRRTGTTNKVTFNGVDYDADNNIELDRWGIQGGVGYGFGLAEVGVTLGYADAQSNGDGEFEADGWNIGLYGRYGGLTGFHAEALFKHDSYDIGFDDLFDGNDGDGNSTGIDGSIGYRFPIGIVPSLDVYAGLSHVWSDMDGVSAFGFDYDFDDMTSTRGRLGVRGNFGGDYNPYLSGALYHEFSGDGDITLCNGSFCDEIGSVGEGTWARIEGGVGGGLGTYGLNIAAWADFGDTRGAGIRAGYRWGGAPRMAEAAYVPPPPPPAPAPATQTCADGSVILATEACPPPPPPPPPPAPGERGL